MVEFQLHRMVVHDGELFVLYIFGIELHYNYIICASLGITNSKI